MNKVNALSKALAQKKMSKEHPRGFGYHSSPKHESVNLTPKHKYNYSKGEQAYIKAHGGLKTKPTEYQ